MSHGRGWVRADPAHISSAQQRLSEFDFPLPRSKGIQHAELEEGKGTVITALTTVDFPVTGIRM
jgi:hypothetical protein